MSAANQITEQQRQRLLTGHYAFARREMVRYWFLSQEDITRIMSGGVNTIAWDTRFSSVCCVTPAGH
jgi:hypothetical protein